MTAGASLTELDLSDNAFGPNGMEGLTDLLKSSSCYRLQALKLNNNGLGIHGGKVGPKELELWKYSQGGFYSIFNETTGYTYVQLNTIC